MHPTERRGEEAAAGSLSNNDGCILIYTLEEQALDALVQTNWCGGVCICSVECNIAAAQDVHGEVHSLGVKEWGLNTPSIRLSCTTSTRGSWVLSC